MTTNDDSPTVIPGFPELAFEHRCRVCQMARTHPGLVKLVHQYRLNEELTDYSLAAAMRPIFERHGLKPPSTRAIGRHMDMRNIRSY